jgi:hypothetical protein
MDKALLKSLIDKLEGKKYQFLNTLKADIKSHISSKKTEDCLILVTTPLSGGSKVTWYPSEGLPYVQRLIAFLSKNNYSESGKTYKVDSILTEEVIQIVTKAFTRFYEENQQLIADYAVAAIAVDQKIANCLFNSLVTNNKATRFASDRVKGAIKDFLIGGFQERVNDFTGTIGHKISITAHKAISAPIATALAAKLSTAAAHAASMSVVKVMIMKIAYYIAAHIGVVIGKLMAVPAIKAIITKLVVVSVVAAMVKAIALKTGMSVGAAITVVLIPVLLAFVAMEWTGFPEKLGGSVADSIAQELGADFSKTNTQILEGLFEEFLGDQGEELGKFIAQDEEVTKQLTNLLTLVHA